MAAGGLASIIFWFCWSQMLEAKNFGGGGYLLPRKELSPGAAAWLVHGSLWALFHLFFQWTLQDLTHMLPTCCRFGIRGATSKEHVAGNNRFGNDALMFQRFK
jgi:hypothetical protein